MYAIWYGNLIVHACGIWNKYTTDTASYMSFEIFEIDHLCRKNMNANLTVIDESRANA